MMKLIVVHCVLNVYEGISHNQVTDLCISSFSSCVTVMDFVDTLLQKVHGDSTDKSLNDRKQDQSRLPCKFFLLSAAYDINVSVHVTKAITAKGTASTAKTGVMWLTPRLKPNIANE